MNAAIRRHLEQREDFGFESTYSGRSQPRIVRAAASNGYAVRAVFIGTNGAEINIERVRQRVRSGTGHDVPLPEITRRWSAAQTNLAETAASLGAIDVLDNSHGVTRHVARITRGEITLPGTPTPEWARIVGRRRGRMQADRRTAQARRHALDRRRGQHHHRPALLHPQRTLRRLLGATSRKCRLTLISQ